MAVDLGELGGKRAGVGQPVGARPERDVRIEMFQNGSRIPRRYRIGGNVPDHYGTGPDDAVIPDTDPFADYRAVSDPDVLPDVDRDGCPHG